MTVKYDDYSWHLESNYPPELPEKNAATHIAMFFAWAIKRGLIGAEHLGDPSTAQELVQARDWEVDPRDLVIRLLDGKLIDEDLSDLGNAFAASYYDQYLDQYARLFEDDCATFYEVPNTSINYELVFAMIDDRYHEWQGNSPLG